MTRDKPEPKTETPVDTEVIRQEIHLNKARIQLGASGVARYVALPGADVSLRDAEEIHHAVVALYAGSIHPLLVDIREVKAISREARKFFASPAAADTTCAVALLVGSPVSRTIGNFFVSLNKPNFPVRLFTDESEAKAWLQEYLG